MMETCGQEHVLGLETGTINIGRLPIRFIPVHFMAGTGGGHRRNKQRKRPAQSEAGLMKDQAESSSSFARRRLAK